MRSLISNSSNATSTVLTLACGPSLLITHTSLSSPSTPPVLINLPIPTMTPDSQPPSKTATVSVPQTHIDKAEHITSLTSTIHDTTLHVTCSIFKTVYTYTLPLPLSSKTLPPQPVTFTTPKRISTITLLPPTPAGAALTTTPLLLVSDKAGDVDCYTLTGDSSRHMYGHTASIITAAATFTSGDEVGVVTGDRDEKVRLSYFPNTHVVAHMFMGHEQFISGIAVHPGNKILATAAGDGTVKLWDIANGVCTDTHNVTENLTPVSLVWITPQHLAFVTDGGDCVHTLLYLNNILVALPTLPADGCICLLASGNKLYAAAVEPTYVKAWKVTSDSESPLTAFDEEASATLFRAAGVRAGIEGITRSVVEGEEGEVGGSKFRKTKMEEKKGQLAKLENPKNKKRKAKEENEKGDEAE